MIRTRAIVLVLGARLLVAATTCETPVGMVLSPGESSIVPAHSETPLTAKPGEILFPGDVLKSRASGAKFLFCPAQSSDELAPSTEVLFGSAQVNVRSGKIADQKKVNSCFLPSVIHVANASQQHYGVSIVRGLSTGPEPQPVPHDKLDAATQAEIKPYDDVLASNPKDLAALVSRAAVYEKRQLPVNALADYKAASAAYPDAVWLKGKIFELGEAVAAQAVLDASKTTGGQTYAVLVGINKYPKLPQEQWLQFAGADANTFEKYLTSPRGGVPPENVKLLTDEKATTAAIRNAFETSLKARAGKNDTVIIVVSAHGVVEPTKGAFIVTYDTDPQDLAATGLPMEEVQGLMSGELSKVGRVAIFVDVCHAGTIGVIPNTKVNTVVSKLGEGQDKIFGFVAGRASEVSREGAEYGGGHGVFSYYLLKSFTGDADSDKDGKVTVNEVIDYVQGGVSKATGGKQHPQTLGGLAGEVALADLTKPSIQLAFFPTLTDPRGGPLLFASGAPPQLGGDITRDAERFEEAVREGRVLPSAQNGAFEALAKLKSELTPGPYLAFENELRIALENGGQQVLLRYLEGDQIPQQQADFLRGAQYFEAAQQLTPESLYLDSRVAFCRGRAELFDKQYGDAANLLERSVRTDPGGAYAYNALGVAYLEQADYARAVPAFHDAVRRAPEWAYPLHNLALTAVQTGDYAGAIRYYQQAIHLTPQFSYLYYNLGLVYQRLNRRREAETFYRQALDRSPNLAEAFNALGSLRAAAGKRTQAEQFYREALAKNADLYAARQNLALLLSSKADRQSEAITLWRDNLSRSPQFLPSRLSLAETLAARGDLAGSIEQYREVVKEKPEYVGAHLALARLLLKNNQGQDAFAEAEAARKLDARSPEILETLGDAQLARGDRAAALQSYESALKSTGDGAAKKRLRGKMSGTHP